MWESFKRFVFALHMVSLGDIMRRRLASSMSAWVPPTVMVAAVLQLAQNQWRAAFVGISQQGSPSPVIPGKRVDAFSVTTTVPNPSVCAALGLLAPVDASGFLHVSSVAGSLVAVTVLKQHMFACSVLGGLLTDYTAERVDNKFCEWRSLL